MGGKCFALRKKDFLMKCLHGAEIAKSRYAYCIWSFANGATIRNLITMMFITRSKNPPGTLHAHENTAATYEVYMLDLRKRRW